MQLGLYVAVSDLEQSKEFYSKLFGIGPYIENDNFIGFKISGGNFGIMKSSAYGYPMIQGNNVVPNIRVSDINTSYKHVKSLKPPMLDDSITDLGGLKLFMFSDPDRNVIEYHSISQ